MDKLGPNLLIGAAGLLLTIAAIAAAWIIRERGVAVDKLDPNLLIAAAGLLLTITALAAGWIKGLINLGPNNIRARG